MAFIDELKIHIKAGHGGNGVVRWRHEKGKEYAGASGGNGGRGGDIYIRGVRDIGILFKYKNIKEFTSQNGQDGMKQSMHGKDGDKLVIDLPIGSVVTNLSTGFNYQLLEEGQEELILHGGRGGFGNEHFKASTNTTPWEYTEGKPGDEADFDIELQLIVDAGFVGFPNAGKSSLLNAITNAKAKIGDYAFTTLEPNLGSLYGFVLADIPGLIEGASEGKGLGYKFLRHIRRTKMIIHCISLENITDKNITDKDTATKDTAATAAKGQKNLEKAYKTIRQELSLYNKELTEKPEMIVLTKTDIADKKTIDVALKVMKKYSKNVVAVSIIDDKSIKEFSDKLVKFLRKQ